MECLYSKDECFQMVIYLMPTATNITSKKTEIRKCVYIILP